MWDIKQKVTNKTNKIIATNSSMVVTRGWGEDEEVKGSNTRRREETSVWGVGIPCDTQVKYYRTVS